MAGDTGIEERKTSGKKSVFDSLRRLPGRMRGDKPEPKREVIVQDVKAIKGLAVGKMEMLGRQKHDDEDEGTDTIAPGEAAAAGAKKFAIQSSTASGSSRQGAGSSIPEEIAPRLIYLTSYGSKVTYPLIWEECTIGRKDDNQIILTDATISKCHCSVFRKSDGYSCSNSASMLSTESPLMAYASTRPSCRQTSK